MAIEQQFKYGGAGAQDDQKQTLSPQGGAGAAQGAAAPGAQPTAPKGQPQGSGQAFNINRYLQANPDAGKNIAGKAESQITGQLGQAKEQAAGRFQSLQDGIAAGQGKVSGAGSQYGQLMSQFGQPQQPAAGQPTQAPQPTEGQPGVPAPTPQFNIGEFDPNSFMQSDAYKQYQDILGGGAVDQQALAQQQTDAYMSQNEALKAAQDRSTQLGTESGRFGLMKELVGTNAAQHAPSYTTGQSRLGQLFMQTQAAPELAALQQKVKGEYIDPLTGQIAQTEAAKDSISGLADQESLAQQSLRDTTKGLYDQYQSSINPQLQSKMDAALADRNQVAGDVDLFQRAMRGDSSAFDPANLESLRRGMESAGLNQDSRTYGSDFSGAALGSIKAAESYNPMQFLDQKEVDRWKGFGDLSGQTANIPTAGEYGATGPQAFTQADLNKNLFDPKKSEIYSEIKNAAPPSRNIESFTGLSQDKIIADLQNGVSPEKIMEPLNALIANQGKKGFSEEYLRGHLAQAQKDQVMNILNQRGYEETVSSRLQSLGQKAAGTAPDEAKRQAILNALAQLSKSQGVPGSGGAQLGSKK